MKTPTSTTNGVCVKCGSGPEAETFDWDVLSSPYRNLLETNDPPPDRDVPHLRSVIAEGRAHVARLDKRIASLKAEFHRILPERNKLVQNVGRFASIISPLRGGMPEELLSNIFLTEVSDVDADTPVEHAIMVTRRVFGFVQVCRHWRSIALSLPRLWSVLAVDFNSAIWDAAEVSVQQLETQLQRSGKHPLTVLFRSCEHGYERNQTYALELVMRQSWRWEAAALYISPHLLLQLAGLKGRLPHLNSLRIEIVGDTPEAYTSSAFEVAPHLQNVYWRHNLVSNLSSATFPSSQLLRYRGVNTWDGHLKILRSASQLDVCALILYDEEGASPDFDAYIPRLRYLFVSNVHFLYRLETPALQELTVLKDLSPVLSLLRRSSCQLKKLVCYACGEVAVLATILESAPSITDIAIQIVSEDPGAFISRLARHDGFCGPNLESISLDVGLSRSPNESIFLNAVEARWRGGKLRSATLFTRNLLLANTQRRIQALNAQGFDLTISNGYMRWVPEAFGLR
ncbi:hypothetical protein B0H15DRAFT_511123 [Mycena belliarum]|uniref:F-box domain-containing protein n=1 Tax=Mycena belliarum TaxID=1033014 RepID=A0AAD6XW50_9AGAR|nr:hypothetical protein B0H15DRAFT_511123 [Mycena belliae]